MTRISKSVLLMGTAILALAACSSSKGPGDIGSKNDIVVRNNGLPGAKPPLPGGDVTDPAVNASNDALAMPPAAVEQGQPLPDTSPEMEAAVQAEEESKAPVASSVSEPMNDPAQPLPPTASEAAIPDAPVTQTATTTPPDAMSQPDIAPTYMPEPVEPPVTAQSAPASPVISEPAPAPADMPAAAPVQAPRSSVYPVEDYPAQPEMAPAPAPTAAVAPAPAPVATAPSAPSANAYVPLPAGSDYPLDPNAPYSPSAMAGRTSASAEPAVTSTIAPPVTAPAVTAPPAVAAPAAPASAFSLTDPVVIRSAQSALKAKGAYAGPENGAIDTTFLNALTAYQVQNKLPVGGLNIETLKSLNVIE